MSNTIFITANWITGALSQQTISRQYDNNRYAVQFIGYPEGDGTEELNLYLLVWMSIAPGQKPGEITPIQLNSDQWYISNYFTQQVQVIKFQLCVLNEAGTYEAHSPIFSGRIGDSLEHNGTSHDIDVSTLFDAYREYVEELIIGAGAMIIDPVPTQGSTNAVSSGGVYEQIEGINTRILDDIKKTYATPFEPTFNVISGGIRTNGTDFDNNPTRARTQYIPVESGKTYYIHLDTTAYAYIGTFLYSTNSGTSVTRSFADGLLGNQDIIFTAEDNEAYFRIGFKNATNSSAEITEENRTTIHDALNIYTPNTDEIREDVKNQGDYINGLIDYPTINWEAFPQITGDDYVLSWRTGFWSNSNTATNSAAAGAIRYWSWIGKQLEAIGTNYVEFTPPSEGHIILKEFESKTATELINRYEIAEPTVIKLHDTHIYRIYIIGLTGEISTYLTEEFINGIGIRPIYSVKDTNKAIRTGEFIRFTVKVNNTWSHTTETDTADHESGEEHDHLCILTLPESYTTNGAKTPLIMYCHGASCGITNSSWYGNGTGEGTAGNFLSMVRSFTAQGYAIFDVNNTRQVSSGFNDWGCLPLMSAYIKAWEYVKEKYNVSDKLYLLSASMGTPVALNMMKWYKGDILASLILAPRPMGIKGRWDNEVTNDRIKEFLVAWGFEPDTILDDETYVVPSKESVFTADIDAKLRGFYHHENMTTISGTDYIFEKFPPTKVMVGTNDTGFLTEVREYFSALQNFGNYINYREVTGQSHGAMCTLVNGDLKSEGLAWFERFRYAEPTEEETL